ncbi:PTS glucose transporter subunit IIA [Thermoflavimicrobium daqui]|uniref:PTS glucose transporter subunit IIA n=1 Tax=Thermoflavimicrobium daqui TaxID=2137476 RepID=A0A364K2H8_9BACL|nr:PTS glucose transporter subunit IIA [Thermoflavimicrobium daqui]
MTFVAPVTGKAVSLDEVEDLVFSQRIAGDGLAIIPTNGKVVAPIDGVVSHLFDTSHAVSIQHPSGLRVLIHVGIDTVKLYGEGFTALVGIDQQVKKGDELIQFDLDLIQQAGCSIATPVVITNMDLALKQKAMIQRNVVAGVDPVLEVLVKGI